MINVKEIPNDELAMLVRTINATGIAPTPTEKLYLEEAACRIELLEKFTTRVQALIEKCKESRNADSC